MFFPRNKVSSHESPFFATARLESCVIARGGIEKKKKEIYVGSACSSSKYMKRAPYSLNEHSLLHFIASQYLGKIT